MRFIAGIVLILAYISGLSQSPIVQFRVDSIDKYIARLDNSKKTEIKRYSGQIDSSRHTEGNNQIVLFGFFHKGNLEIIQYEFEGDDLGLWTITYFVKENELLCIEEKYLELIEAGGPNLYEMRFKGRYYFKAEQLIYRKIEGTEEHLSQGQKDMSRLLGDYALFKKLLMSV